MAGIRNAMTTLTHTYIVRHGGALAMSTTFNRRVVGSLKERRIKVMTLAHEEHLLYGIYPFL